jgi:hypothetical protein
MAQQMTFADIGTLYNSIANELQGGVTPQNQDLLIHQVSTVQTQLQGLIDSGTLNNLDGAGKPAVSVVHAQNIVDQMNFLKTEIGAFGTGNYVPKFINDVVRDVQDIVAGDAALAALAHQDNHSGFQQVSFLLTNPTPFSDSPAQTATLNQFISDSNSLAARAENLASAGPIDPNSAAVQLLESDIHTFSVNADAYSTAPEQAGLFSARFNNEFTLNGVQGTASRELITGLQTGNADLINGAAEVLKANAQDVQGNMLAQGANFTPVQNFVIPDRIDTVHDAGVVFDDAVTKLLGGVYSDAKGGNQASILNDLSLTKTGLQNTITDQGLTGLALHDVQHVISLLDQESTLVGGIDTAQPTPVSAVNGQIGHIEAQILNIINHDPTLAAMAVGADGTVGFVALPPGTTSGNVNVATGHDVGHPGHGNVATGHDVGLPGHGNFATGHDMGPGHGDVVALASLAHLWGH